MDQFRVRNQAEFTCLSALSDLFTVWRGTFLTDIDTYQCLLEPYRILGHEQVFLEKSFSVLSCIYARIYRITEFSFRFRGLGTPNNWSKLEAIGATV